MNVRVNGKITEAAQNTNLSDLITSLRIKAEEVVVLLNEVVVKRDRWMSTTLAEGDSLELVSLVGGG